MRNLVVGDAMLVGPHSIGVDQTLNAAHRLMRENQIRHLPVLRGGELVGIVSDRDLKLLETLRDVDPDDVKVEEAMSQEIVAVDADAPLWQVADEMARHKIGCVVIKDGSKLSGIFTVTDACRVLAKILRERQTEEPSSRM